MLIFRIFEKNWYLDGPFKELFTDLLMFNILYFIPYKQLIFYFREMSHYLKSLIAGILLVVFHLSSAQDVNVFLIGDLGISEANAKQTLEYLDQVSSEATQDDVLIFLGNNVFPIGLPPLDHEDRPAMEQKLKVQLDAIKKFPGQSFMIPGDDDWGQTRKFGWDYVKNQQTFVTDYLQDDFVFLPQGGCPGPIEIGLSGELVLLIVDTQYFLHPWDKPRKEDGCEVDGTLGALEVLEDAVQRNRDKHILVVGHHPIYTYGAYGTGPGLKKQSVKNPRYKVIREGIAEIFKNAEHLVYASGHEKSLQYIRKDDNHFVVSGSGSSKTSVKGGEGTRFSKSSQGFAQLIYKENGPTLLKFWDSELRQSVYDEELFNRDVQSVKEAFANRPDYSDSVVLASGNSELALKSESQKFWLGNSFRKEWAVQMEIPVFDIEREHGGLQIVQRGGGGQTKSLRLEAENGRQYVLRSIKKWPIKAVPITLRKTFALEIANDQMSSSHPYGAFAIPDLAETAGLFHTNPKLVYIPNDPNFGIYRSEFAGLVMLYEERPNDEAAFEPHFGSTKQIEGTPKVIEELKKDNDNSIDDHFLVRNRMFDMWIGDWDRHDDQWRWAEYKKKNGPGKLYKPIPRDRDQAFFITEGVIPRVLSAKWAWPAFQGMKDDMRWVPGFNWQARWLDRAFLSQLEWKDWQLQIDELQEALTDEAIEIGLKRWPQPIYDLSAERITPILKKRRENLDSFGRKQYEYLAKSVDILGSDKHEYFLVDRMDNDRTKITVHKMNKDMELDNVIYERTFLSNETKEIMLYGFGNEDVFELKGNVSRGPKVRIIGGGGKDKIIDKSRVSGLSKKTVVYDKIKSTTLEKSGETRSRISNDPEVNMYDRKAFKYNKLFPLIDINFNPDDGLFLGGGFLWVDHGFRKEPFQQKHRLSGNYALATSAFAVKYAGTFTDALGKWDLNTSINVIQPFGVANYFGLGNESTFDYKGEGIAGGFEDAIDFYRIRYELYDYNLSFSYNFGQFSTFTIGSRFARFEVQERPGRFISDPTNQLDLTRIFDSFYFGGVSLLYNIDTRDNQALPSKGINFNLQFDSNYGLKSNSRDFNNLKANLSHYFQIRVPSKIVIANKVEFEKVFGNTEFFNSVLLGQGKLRGYRRSRFIGETGFYHNFDVRIKLFSFSSYLFPGSVGILGFHDIGRVWLDGESSDKWHNSMGFGLWLTPLDLVAVNFTLAYSDEETLPLLTMKYHF